MSRRIAFLSLYLSFILGFPSFLYADENIDGHEYAVLERVQQKLAKDDYQAALSLVLPLLDRKMPSSFALSFAGTAYANLGQYKDAVKVWQRGVSLFPVTRNLWYNLAITQMQLEEYRGAIQSFAKIIDLDSQQHKNVADIYYQLAFAYYQLRNFAKAEQMIKVITLQASPKRHWLLLQINSQIAQMKWGDAEKIGRKLAALNPTDDHVWQLLGQIAVNSQEYKKAISYTEISQATMYSKSNAQVLGQLYGAEQLYAEQVRVKRTYEDLNINHIEQLMQAWQFDQALSALLTLDKQYGPNMESAFLLGKVYFALGQKEQALASLAGLEKRDYLFLQRKPAANRDKAAQLRQAKDTMKAKALLLCGQIYWLDHKWLEARDVYKRLELIPGYQETGKSLAESMQAMLSEKEKPVVLPEILDPPVVVGASL